MSGIPLEGEMLDQMLDCIFQTLDSEGNGYISTEDFRKIQDFEQFGIDLTTLDVGDKETISREDFKKLISDAMNN